MATPALRAAAEAVGAIMVGTRVVAMSRMERAFIERAGAAGDEALLEVAPGVAEGGAGVRQHQAGDVRVARAASPARGTLGRDLCIQRLRQHASHAVPDQHHPAKAARASQARSSRAQPARSYGSIGAVPS